MKVVINACFGGFSLSDAAYEKLIEWGVPVRKYIEQARSEKTGLFLPEPLNDGEIIFDRALTLKGENKMNDIMYWDAIARGGRGAMITGRYWDSWIDQQRSHPLLIRVVEELGAGHRTGASGIVASLKIVEIPDGVDYVIEEYDGNEHIAEAHREWR